MTYTEYISQFEVFDNPPKKDGYDRHHIVPESEQVKMYGSVIDQRQVYLTLPQHMYAHILYDREHGTKTAKTFLTICGKSAEFFTCYELCLAYSYTLRKKRKESHKKAAEAMKRPEVRQKMFDSLKEVHNNPEYRQRLSNSVKESWSNPEIRQKRSDCIKEAMNKPEVRQKVLDSLKEAMNRPEVRQKISNSNKGKNTWAKGQKWFNDGVKCVRAYECPEGFVSGRLYHRRPSSV